MSSGQPDHTKVTLMKGTDPSGNLVTIAVDANGNMIAVMKGGYEGSLKTLATDQDGRLLAKLTDPTNIWGDTNIIGNIEQAVRLGALSRYERRGDNMWFDDFSCGFGSVISAGTGTGAAKVLSTDNWRTNGYAAKLTTPSDSGYDVWVYHSEYPLDPTTNFGFEVTFSHSVGIECFYIIMDFTGGGGHYYYRLRWIADTDTLQYLGSDGNWHDISTDVSLKHFVEWFATFKLVVDQEAQEYLRVYASSHEYDLSGIGPDKTVGANPPDSLLLKFMVEGSSGGNYDAYVDNLIFTVNEPAA